VNCDDLKSFQDIKHDLTGDWNSVFPHLAWINAIIKVPDGKSYSAFLKYMINYKKSGILKIGMFRLNTLVSNDYQLINLVPPEHFVFATLGPILEDQLS
jgi:hypothetical protein